MRRLLAVTSSSLSLAACQFIPGTDAHKILEAQELAAVGLADPAAAQFRKVMIAKPDEVVCGEINGKNDYGAYVGFRKFYVENGVAHIEPEPRIELTDVDRLRNAAEDINFDTGHIWNCED